MVGLWQRSDDLTVYEVTPMHWYNITIGCHEAPKPKEQ